MQFKHRRHEYLGKKMVSARNGLRALFQLTRPAAFFVFLLLLAGHSFAGNAVLNWDPVVANPTVTGYKVHYGPAAGNYTTTINVGNVTLYTVGGLTDGTTYHFAVTAYTAAGTQSGYSNDVSKFVPYASPVADFGASTTSGPAPLAMNFINSSTGVITTYAWSFGDGGTSTLQNPSHIYSTAGVYTVALTVTGPGGSSTKSRPSFITVTGLDTSAPTTPSSLTATASGTSTVNLAWSACTDNVGVTGYRIERCQGVTCTNFVQIATSAGTTFSNTGLTAATAYRYRVRANDAAGNLSGYSPVATATTIAGGDTSAPTTPSSLTATASGTSTVNLAWSASTDNVGVTGYRIERCQGASCTNFAQIATSTGTTFSNTGLTAATAYRYRVRANDAAGNLSGYSPVATATTVTVTGPDTSPPTAPSSLTATANGSTAINLAWAASTDNVGVFAYKVERCQGATCTNFAQIATPAGTTFADNFLTAGITYRYRVRAADVAGNVGGYSPTATATTAGGADTSPPTAPSSLTATPNGSTAINLAWAASTDNVGVFAYKVERCQGATCTNFAQIATPTGTTFSNIGLVAGTTYRYRVRATDVAGNLSGYSSIAAATTSSGAASAPISFVQVSSAVPQSPQATVPVTFAKAQVAGNLNVVVVGWNDTNASVTSVTDSKGNMYTRAVGPTTVAGTLSQSIYYAKSIVAAAAGTNILTVKFNVPAVYPDIRIVEYSGLDKVNPVDKIATGSGTGTLSSTASVTTTSANTLLFGANTVTALTIGAGVGFTSRMITSPNGDIAQDRVVATTGTYSATAPLTGGSWVIQMVAFKAAP